MDLKRVTTTTLEHVETFVETYKELLQQYDLKPELIINVDESGAAPGPQNLPQTINAVSGGRCGQVMPPVDTLKTVLPFVNAAGRVLMLVLIFANVHDDENQQAKPIYYLPDEPPTKDNFPIYYASTTAGYITTKLWEDCIGRLVGHLKPIQGDSPGLIIFDRHSAHLSPGSMITLLENNIQPLLLPAHMTHVMQPLDDAPFAVFKKKLAEMKREQTAQHIFRRERPNNILQKVVVEAFTASFTENVIKAAFERTGIWPFNESLIVERAKEVLPSSEKSGDLSLQEEVVEMCKQQLQLNKPLEEKRKSTIPEKNKLFTGRELLEFEEKKAKEAENKKQRATKKRKREEGEKESRKKQKGEGEDSEPNHQLEERLKHQCRICSKPIQKKWTHWSCPTCHSFRLCKDHMANYDIRNKHCSSCTIEVTESGME